MNWTIILILAFIFFGNEYVPRPLKKDMDTLLWGFLILYSLVYLLKVYLHRRRTIRTNTITD